MPRRSDDGEIAIVIAELAERMSRGEFTTSLRPETPRFLFHVTQFDNALSALRLGKLYSRAEIDRLGAPMIENASPEIVGSTRPWVKDQVRLYFRPKTATFYRNEQFRTPGEIWHGAHMPFPVALMFDAATVLGETGTRFSHGNLASAGHTVLTSGADALRRLPFHLIYH
ncbi:MAG: DarT ssDNA thymidine ADP-ribosyltransferase family protein [Thermomicrobiales bacterium]